MIQPPPDVPTFDDLVARAEKSFGPGFNAEACASLLEHAWALDPSEEWARQGLQNTLEILEETRESAQRYEWLLDAVAHTRGPKRANLQTLTDALKVLDGYDDRQIAALVTATGVNLEVARLALTTLVDLGEQPVKLGDGVRSQYALKAAVPRLFETHASLIIDALRYSPHCFVPELPAAKGTWATLSEEERESAIRAARRSRDEGWKSFAGGAMKLAGMPVSIAAASRRNRGGKRRIELISRVRLDNPEQWVEKLVIEDAVLFEAQADAADPWWETPPTWYLLPDARKARLLQRGKDALLKASGMPAAEQKLVKARLLRQFGVVPDE